MSTTWFSQTLDGCQIKFQDSFIKNVSFFEPFCLCLTLKFAKGGNMFFKIFFTKKHYGYQKRRIES